MLIHSPGILFVGHQDPEYIEPDPAANAHSALDQYNNGSAGSVLTQQPVSFPSSSRIATSTGLNRGIGSGIGTAGHNGFIQSGSLHYPPSTATSK